MDSDAVIRIICTSHLINGWHQYLLFRIVPLFQKKLPFLLKGLSLSDIFALIAVKRLGT
jgi:hypothetical protein